MTTSRHVHSLNHGDFEFKSELGSISRVCADHLPILKNLSIKRLTLAPGAIREPHWHANAVELASKSPLKLEWSLLLPDGTHYRLGSVETAPVDFSIDVYRTNNGTFASVRATCPGACWAVQGIAELRDGLLVADAPAEVVSAP